MVWILEQKSIRYKNCQIQSNSIEDEWKRVIRFWETEELRTREIAKFIERSVDYFGFWAIYTWTK